MTLGNKRPTLPTKGTFTTLSFISTRILRVPSSSITLCPQNTWKLPSAREKGPRNIQFPKDAIGRVPKGRRQLISGSVERNGTRSSPPVPKYRSQSSEGSWVTCGTSCQENRNSTLREKLWRTKRAMTAKLPLNENN